MLYQKRHFGGVFFVSNLPRSAISAQKCRFFCIYQKKTVTLQPKVAKVINNNTDKNENSKSNIV